MSTAINLPPEAEEESIPSRSQAELVSEFIAIDERLKELRAQREDLAMQLAGIAWENRTDQNTGRVAGMKGPGIKVVFGKTYSYDTDLMRDVVHLLGGEVFDSLFKTKIEFTAQKRALNKFMTTSWPEEERETAKKIIKDATITQDKRPYVTVE